MPTATIELPEGISYVPTQIYSPGNDAPPNAPKTQLMVAEGASEVLVAKADKIANLLYQLAEVLDYGEPIPPAQYVVGDPSNQANWHPAG